jgi:GNAT superfamily N-acetyltransferase
VKPKSPQIRDATPADAAGIAAVHIVSSNDAYAPLARHWVEADRQERIRRWQSSLAETEGDPARLDLIAQLDGEIVGFISAGPVRRSDVGAELEVYVVHVHPRHRGKGIGGRLWTAACDRVRGPSLRSILVETLAEHARGDTAFALVELLWRTGKQRPRVRELAAKARDAYRRAGEQYSDETEHIAQWLRDHGPHL